VIHLDGLPALPGENVKEDLPIGLEVVCEHHKPFLEVLNCLRGRLDHHHIVKASEDLTVIVE
jgi:hypothetical protein